MNFISPLIAIKPKKIKVISQYLCDNEEILFASKVQFHYPPNRNLPAQVGYLVLTYGFIYIFTKENKELQFQEQFCVFNCQEIKFLNEKGNNTKSAILIKTDSDLNLFTIFNGEKMDVFYEYLVNSISIISNGRQSQFTAPKLHPHIHVKSFPVQFRIFKRSLYLIHLDMKNEKIPKSSLDGANYFNNNEIYFKGQLLIDSNFHPNNLAEYYGKAIGYEPSLMVVVFQNYIEEFAILLESILKHSIKIRQIKFNEYIKGPLFNFEKVSKTTIEKIQFANSGFNIIENFMSGCINNNFSIKNIKINAVEIHKSDLISVFENLNKLKCFNDLTVFALVNSKIELFKEFPYEIIQPFLKSHQKLESLTLSDINAEGTSLFEEICKSRSNINELHLNYLNFENALNSGDDQNPVNLPHKIVLLDFSHSTFKNSSMTPLLQLLTKDDKNVSNLMVNLSHLEPKENTFVNAFKGVDLKACKPKIIDFDWSANCTSPDFFNFISTQKNLQFLSLLGLTIEKQNGFFQALMKCLKDSHLLGIEIGCNTFDHQFVNSFFDFLKKHQILQHFCFHCQNDQNKIGEKLAEFISRMSNLKEVCIDAKGLSNDMCLKIASAIENNKSVVAYALKGWDIDYSDPKVESTIAIANKIQKMKAPTTMDRRAFLSISNKKNSELESSSNIEEEES